MKRRSTESRALLRHLRDAESIRWRILEILERAQENKSGFSDIRLIFHYGTRRGLPVLLGPKAIKDALRGHLTAFYDALSGRPRPDLDIPKATRGCYWLQGYYSARKIIEAVQARAREGLFV